MNDQRFETVIIGAGQGGLAVGHHLARRDHRFVILDALHRVGDNWRRHYDSLKLYNPAKFNGLPGMSFPAPRWSFPTRDQVADFLEAYAAKFELPVRTGVKVDRLARNGDGYLVTAGEDRFQADNVVVATGTFGRPYTPAFAGELDPEIVQLHSSEYKNPSQLQPGPVLVVGAAHSGADIALEVVAAGHETVLSGRDTGQVPFDIESPRMRPMWPVLSFVARRVLTIRTPVGRRIRPKIRAHGGPLLRVKTRDLQAAGVERVFERTIGVEEGRPVLDAGRTLDVANVIWCTGFRQRFEWIDLPVIGEDGWPLERCGVVESSPGLYFMGLAFQYSFGSTLFIGVKRDAAHVARHIVRRMANGRTPVTSAAADVTTPS
jgi:putative flavoprotein involved in K+ transport